MVYTVPNLDDRTFQALVDEAKRFVQQRNPDWTDHNVSDPGVTLIETFASMTEQIIYRLNRLPDRFYVKFLELIGVRLYPPTAARTDVTFWLTTPQESPFTIPAGTRISTLRTDIDEAVTFTTFADCVIHPCAFQACATRSSGEEAHRWQTERIIAGNDDVRCFGDPPTSGDQLVVGITDPVPGNVLVLRIRADIEGVGVDPRNPPLVWEAFDGAEWHECEVDSDGTGGLNRDGDVVLHVPREHAAGIIDEQRAGWIRARLVDPEDGQPAYLSSPTLHSITAFTMGGSVTAANAEYVEVEVVGVSEGVAGQRFPVQRGPVLAATDACTVEVSGEQGWEPWTIVADFVDSSPRDHHVVLDAVAGELTFGPALRLTTGEMRHYGAVPSKGCEVRLRAYGIGGGRRGNVAKNTITVLRSSIPYVARVQNRRPAVGGVDAETLEDAKLRGPITMRTRGRAVTAEDYEFLAKEAAPEVARVHCVPAGEGVDAGSVRVLVVPSVPVDRGRISFEQLVPPEESLRRIARRLDECRLVGARVLIEPPLYRGVTVVARVKARPRTNSARLQADALDAMYTYLNPLVGGPAGKGWPFGRTLQSGELFALLQGLMGTELVQDVRLFGADPITGQRGQATQRLELEAHALVFSYEHQVLVDEG